MDNAQTMRPRRVGGQVFGSGIIEKVNRWRWDEEQYKCKADPQGNDDMERFYDLQKSKGLNVVEATFKNVKETLELILVDLPQFKPAIEMKIREFCERNQMDYDVELQKYNVLTPIIEKARTEDVTEDLRKYNEDFK